MAFRFPLETAFHFRQSGEHQQELRLRAANQQVAGERRLIEQLEQRIEEIRDRQSRELSAGTTAAELRFALLCETALRHQRGVREQELLRLQALRDQQREDFRKARRERETLESLRNSQLREYERDRVRRGQRQLDDLYLLRQAHRRRG